MSDAVLVKQVCECVPAWRAQLADMCAQMEAWGAGSLIARNVLRELRMLDSALFRFADSMRFKNPYYEHEIKMMRARKLAAKRLAEGAARRVKEQAHG